MSTYYLKFTLESDAAFGRGDGVASLVDAEVQHDELGCPYLRGRALKGILVNECAEILAALSGPAHERWATAAQRLFGCPGSDDQAEARLAVGDARLPEDLRQAIAQDIKAKRLTRAQVLETLTAVRHQTAMEEGGVPKPHTLRAIRVVIRGTPFWARLNLTDGNTEEKADDLALLAACVKAFRRAGTGRNRGLGRLSAELLDEQEAVISPAPFLRFRQEVLPCTP